MGTGGATGWILHCGLKQPYGGRTDGDRMCRRLDTPQWSKTVVWGETNGDRRCRKAGHSTVV